MKLMAIMAHPDDAEIWCGGTLIFHVGNGDQVRICSLSYERESTRGKEALEGAKLIGCEVELLGLEDTAIRDTDNAIEGLIRCLDSFQPDTIITHWYDDMHPDHESTFRISRRALVRYCFLNSIDDLESLPRIFCCDTYNSLGIRGPFRPDRFVDITQTWEKKIEVINAHKSQNLSTLLNMIERQGLVHGKAAGVKRAEAFLYLPFFGRPDVGPPLGG